MKTNSTPKGYLHLHLQQPLLPKVLYNLKIPPRKSKGISFHRAEY